MKKLSHASASRFLPALRRIPLAALAVSMLLVLVSCGDDSDTEGPTNSAGGAEPAAEAEPERDDTKTVPAVGGPSPHGASASATVEGLTMVARRQQSYVVEFMGRPDEELFQITRHASTQYRRDTFLVKLGEVTTDGKLKIETFEPAEKTTDTGIVVDASKLTATYVDTGEVVELIRREKLTVPTYFAELNYGPWQLEKRFYRIGEEVVLPEAPTPTYKVIDIKEDSTTLSHVDEAGKEVMVEITKLP